MGDGEILLGALAKGECVEFQVAMRSTGEIGINFGEDGVGIVKSLVNVGEKQMNVAEVRVEANGVECAALGIGGTASRILHETETVFPGRRVGGLRKPLANEDFRLGVFAATVKDHGKAKQRRSIGGFGGVDGLLEILAGLVQVAEFVLRDSEIVIRGVVVGGQLGGVLEISEARLRIPTYEKLAPLFEGASGFARHAELLDGNDGGFRRGGRGRELGEAGQAAKKACQERKEAFRKIHKAPRGGFNSGRRAVRGEQ